MRISDAEIKYITYRDSLARASATLRKFRDLPEHLHFMEVTASARVASAQSSTVNRTLEEAKIFQEKMDELKQGLLLVGSKLQDADDELRKAKRIIGGDSKAVTANFILNEASIRLVGAELPVLSCGLLDSQKPIQDISIQEMLDLMSNAFEAAKISLNRIINASVMVDTMVTNLVAEMSGISDDVLHGELIELRKLSNIDPLGALEKLEIEVEPKIKDKIKEWIARLDEKSQADRLLASARLRLDKIEYLDKEVKALQDTCLEKIDGIQLLLLNQEDGTELYAWINRLVKVLSEDNINAFNIGLKKWEMLLNRVQANRRSAKLCAQGALRELDRELSLWGALRAQHKEMIRNGLENTRLESTAGKIKNFIECRPIPLAQLQKEISFYEKELMLLPIKSEKLKV